MDELTIVATAFGGLGLVLGAAAGADVTPAANLMQTFEHAVIGSLAGGMGLPLAAAGLTGTVLTGWAIVVEGEGKEILGDIAHAVSGAMGKFRHNRQIQPPSR